MSLLPREASFSEEISDYFLAFRGAGLTLSPLDAELVLDWQDRGIPYDVACRGIRRAAEQKARDVRPGEPALRSLRACSRAVEEEFRRYQGLSAGRAQTSFPPEQVAHDRLGKARAALKKAGREASGPARTAVARVLALAGPDGDRDPAVAAAAVARLDDALALLYLRALPFAERLALLRLAREPLAPVLHGMSVRARRAALRAHRVLHARTHGVLPALK